MFNFNTLFEIFFKKMKNLKILKFYGHFWLIFKFGSRRVGQTLALKISAKNKDIVKYGIQAIISIKSKREKLILS